MSAKNRRDRNDRSNDNRASRGGKPGADAGRRDRKRRLQLESLEDRILLSATWADADAVDPDVDGDAADANDIASADDGSQLQLIGDADAGDSGGDPFANLNDADAAVADVQDQLDDLASNDASDEPHGDQPDDVEPDAASDASDSTPGDGPTIGLKTPPATGAEDAPIALDIALDINNAESARITISNIPSGASLSAGTPNPDGSVGLTPDQLDGLTIQPPSDFSGEFDLDIHISATGEAPIAQHEAITFDADEVTSFTNNQDRDGGFSVSDSGDTLSLAGNTWKDIPFEYTVTENTVVEFEFRSTTEGEAHCIGFANSDRAEEDRAFKIHGTQDWGFGTILNSGNDDPYSGDGEWQSFKINVGEHFTGDFDSLTFVNDDDTSNSQADGSFRNVRVYEADEAPPQAGEPTTVEMQQSLRVVVEAEADGAELSVAEAHGVAGQTVAIDITAALRDADGSERLTEVRLGNVPEGVSFNAGHANADGSWTVPADQIDGLTAQTPFGQGGTFELSIEADTVESSNGDIATTTGVLTMTVNPVASLDASDAAGLEDQPIELDIDVSFVGAEGRSAELLISNVPAGATLSAGVDHGDGSWTVPTDQAEGLTIRPAADFHGEFDLNITLRVTQDGDAPAVTFAEDRVDSYGGSGQDKAGEITVADDGARIDLAGNTWKSVPFDYDITENTVLEFEFRSDAEGEIHGIGLDNSEDIDEQRTFKLHGTQNWGSTAAGEYTGDGEWQSFRINVGEHYDGSVDRLFFVNDHDKGGAVHSAFQNVRIYEADQPSTEAASFEINESLRVTVENVADAPTLSVADAVGLEDTLIPLEIDADLAAGDEADTISIRIDGLPEGAALVANTPEIEMGELDLQTGGDVTVTFQNEDAGYRNSFGYYRIDPHSGELSTPELAWANASAKGSGGDLLRGESGFSFETDPGEKVGFFLIANGDRANDFDDLDGGRFEFRNTDGSPATLDSAKPDLVHVADDGTETVLRGSIYHSPAQSQHTQLNPDGIAHVRTQVDADSGRVTMGFEDMHGGGDRDFDDIVFTMDIDASNIQATPDYTVERNDDGSWNVGKDALAHLSVRPPDNFSGELNLTVTATNTSAPDGDATTVQSLRIDVEPDADQASLNVNDVSGLEDQAIPLDIDAALTDTDGSETLSLTVAGLPNGASLSAGVANADGSWTLNPAELDGLTVTPPANFDGSFDLTITATSTDGADTANVSQTLTVDVEAVADAPVLETMNATGDEDTSIPIDIAAAVTDADETLFVTVSNLPDGASLSAGTQNPDGSWTLTTDELDGLHLDPPANFSGDITLTITATSADGDDIADVTQTIDVTVSAVADAPLLQAADVTGLEDTAIPLDIGATLTDDSETLAVTISGVPEGASLSAGVNNGDGSWTLTPSDLPGLTITPPVNYSGTFDLNVTATSTDGIGDAARERLVLDLDFNDHNNVGRDSSGFDNHGQEVGDIDTNDGVATFDGDDALRVASSTSINKTIVDNETISIRFKTDSADGRQVIYEQGGTARGLNVYIDNGVLHAGGWNKPEHESNWGGTYLNSGRVDDGEWHTVTLTLNGGLDVSDGALKLYLDGELAGEGEGSQLWMHGDAIGVGGLNAGTVFQDGPGRGDFRFDGQLDHVRVYDDVYTPEELTRGGSSTATSSANISVNVTPVADSPTLNVANASGAEDASIPLELSAALVDADESLGVIITGMPDGATLSAGVQNADGSWSVAAEDLGDLAFDPPNDFAGDVQLTVTATSTDGADTASVSETIDITVTPVADAPDLIAEDATGFEDTPIQLDLAAALTDTDGSESLAVTIAGVPDGAALSASTQNDDGSWTVDPGDLPSLTLTPPTNFAGDIELAITATATDGDDEATETATFTVHVTPMADVPNLQAVNLGVAERGESHPVSIDASLNDTDGSETLSFTVYGLNNGLAFNAGEELPNGAWRLTPNDLDNLELTVPNHYNQPTSLLIQATSTEGANQASASTLGVISFEPAPSTTPSPSAPPTDTPANQPGQPSADPVITPTDPNDAQPPTEQPQQPDPNDAAPQTPTQTDQTDQPDGPPQPAQPTQSNNAFGDIDWSDADEMAVLDARADIDGLNDEIQTATASTDQPGADDPTIGAGLADDEAPLAAADSAQNQQSGPGPELLAHVEATPRRSPSADIAINFSDPVAETRLDNPAGESTPREPIAGEAPFAPPTGLSDAQVEGENVTKRAGLTALFPKLFGLVRGLGGLRTGDDESDSPGANKRR